MTKEDLDEEGSRKHVFGSIHYSCRGVLACLCLSDGAFGVYYFIDGSWIANSCLEESLLYSRLDTK